MQFRKRHDNPSYMGYFFIFPGASSTPLISAGNPEFYQLHALSHQELVLKKPPCPLRSSKASNKRLEGPEISPSFPCSRDPGRYMASHCNAIVTSHLLGRWMLLKGQPLFKKTTTTTFSLLLKLQRHCVGYIYVPSKETIQTPAGEPGAARQEDRTSPDQR